MYRARQKSNPKFYISKIVAAISTKFAEFTEENSVDIIISCKFY